MRKTLILTILPSTCAMLRFNRVYARLVLILSTENNINSKVNRF
jgi:hypothetical protein